MSDHVWNRSLYRTVLGWGLVLLLAGVTACGGETNSEAGKYPPCVPETVNANVYNAPTHEWMFIIHELSNSSIPQTDQNWGTRYAALKFLTEETRRWSAIQEIIVDNTSKAYIVITFIHPDLLQAVYLNEVLEHKLVVSDLDAGVKRILSEVAQRNELLFLVAVAITDGNFQTTAKHTLDIPISQMELVNSKNIHIQPSHNDQNLDQVISSSQVYEFGFIGYPVGIQVDGICEWVLDPQFNKNIVIVSHPITLNSTPNADFRTWTIPYVPLIDTGAPNGAPDFGQPPYDASLFSSLFTPPARFDQVNQDLFWQDYARFVWKQITFGK